MRTNPQCCQLLTEAKDYHIVVSKQPTRQTARTQVRSDRKSLVMCHAENLESYHLETEKHAYLKDCQVALYNPCVCVVDNFMYTCGGKYDSNDNNDIATARCFRYDPRFDTWYELTSMNEARKDFVLIAYKKKLFAIGGQDENNVMCSVESFDIEKNDWEPQSPVSYAVYNHAGALLQGLIFICGGRKFTGHCKDVMCFSPDKDQWKEETPLMFSRSNHSMLEVKDYIYVIGGSIDDPYGFSVAVTSIERFCLDSRQWTLCEAQLNIREAGACTLDGKIYIIGGINGQHYYSDLVQCYDPDKDSMNVVERFQTRIFGQSCCVLTLPQYV